MTIDSTRPHIPASLAPVGDGRLLLTLNEAAQSLSVSKRTLERLIAGGFFPLPLKIGRSSRVSREDLGNYLEQLRRARGEKLGTS